MNLDPLRWAKFFAVIKHGNQTYSGCLPYSHHLAAVEAVLRRFGVTSQYMLEAAWLHDTMEDTGTKKKEICEFFGDKVADLVEAVTNEPGPNRKIRGMLTYPKIRAYPEATLLKLADRIANVEQGGKLVDMYRKEYEDFRRALYPADKELMIPSWPLSMMWDHLDKLMEKEE